MTNRLYKTLCIGLASIFFMLPDSLQAEAGTFKSRAPQVIFNGFSSDATPKVRAIVQDHLELTSESSPIAPQANSIKITVEKILADRGLSPRIHTVRKIQPEFNLLEQDVHGIVSDSFTFQANGIPICNAMVRSHQTAIGRMTLMGSIPAGDIDPSFGMDDFPLAEDALWRVMARLSETYNRPSSDFQVSQKRACLWAAEDSLIPVWNFRIDGDGIAFEASASELFVVEIIPQVFHIDGTAEIYPNNPMDNELKTFKMSGLAGSGYLENDYFKVITQSGLPSDYAFSEDHNFSFPEMTSEFKQTSLFVNANRTLSWLQSMGYRNFGSEKIQIVAHYVMDGGGINNATYHRDVEGNPFISVSDGDGKGLQNLPVDRDVVSHEFGHHVLFHSVTNISGQSLVLHEAIADFLTFAQTGDPCIGESICPKDSPFDYCVKRGQCLRTAENSYRFDETPPETRQPHLRSQFFSGFLWDLISKDDIDRNTLTKMTLGAIDLLVSNSGYQHMILGLLIVDDASYNGQYCQKIYNRAVQRGMQSLVESFKCDVLPSLIDSTGLSQQPKVTEVIEKTTPINQTSSSNRSSSSWCGSTGTGAGGPMSLIVMLLSPLTLYLRRRRETS